jgi:hypothetical protein
MKNPQKEFFYLCSEIANGKKQKEYQQITEL